jgi:hypothetical protein
MLHVYNPHHHRACVQPSPSSCMCTTSHAMLHVYNITRDAACVRPSPSSCLFTTLTIIVHVHNPHHHRACVQPSPSSHLNRACSLRLNLHSRRIIVAGCLKNTPPLSTRSQCDRHRTATPCSRSGRVCQHASKHVGAHETLTVQTNDRMFARVAVTACCCACAELCVCG